MVYMAEFTLEEGMGDNLLSEHFKQIWNCASSLVCFQWSEYSIL